nr:MAG TPA: hypothetical protein [Caudoviricetes sp.]
MNYLTIILRTPNGITFQGRSSLLQIYLTI